MDDIPEIHTNADASASAQYAERQNEEFSMMHSELVRFLTQSQQMRDTARSSVKQSLYAGSGAFAGSFLGGPIGGLVGGVAGSIIGYIKSDDYDGALMAVLNLEGDRRQRLVEEVGQVLTAAGATAQQLRNPGAFHDALCQLAEQDSVRNGVWRACLDSVRG